MRKLKYIIVFLVLTFSNSLIFSQVDSALIKELILAKSETEKVRILLELSKNSIDFDPNQSHEFAMQALTISEKEGLEPQKSESYRRIGIYYMYHSDYPKAMENIIKAMQIAEKLNNKLLIAKCLMNVGAINYDYSEYNLALDNFSKSLTLAKEIDDKETISGCLTNIANVYTNLQDYKMAIKNYQEAIKISTEREHTKDIYKALINIGNVYTYEKKYVEAEKNYFKALKITNELNDKTGSVTCLNNIGNLYLQTKKLDKALDYSNQSLDLAIEIGSKSDMQLAIQSISRIYKAKGDFKSALAYFEASAAVKDSIFSDSKNKEFGKLESKFELEKKQTEIDLLEKDKALNEAKAHREVLNRNLIIVGIVLGFVGLLTFIQYINNKKTKEYNQQLISQNKEIKAQSEALVIAHDELDKFIYRSSHDLKAPLTSVLGLINISKMEKTMENIPTFLQKMHKSVDKLMLVLRDLTSYSANARSEILAESIDFRILLDKSLTELAYHENFPKVEITHTIVGENQFFSDSSRIGILLTNMISNGISHADFTKDKSTVNIHITQSLEKSIILIQDNGKGIRDEIKPRMFEMFYKGTNDSQGAGLGLYIVKGVVNKLNGKMDFSTDEGIGTSFRFEFPSLKGLI
ncbi:MAG: GHKL domain-containing protein [Bacteroidetes bacterium]|nr:MAG: GHKL domain-containing protein [Bacteroidota bacterium]